MNTDSTQSTEVSATEEVLKMTRENRKFTILQRERAMSEAEQARNRSAVMAGLCTLGAVVAYHFSGQDINQSINNILQHELNSWEALGQYFQDLGPLTTLLSASAGGFISRTFRHSRNFQQAQNELVDFNASLEDTQSLGGNENAKSR